MKNKKASAIDADPGALTVARAGNRIDRDPRRRVSNTVGSPPCQRPAARAHDGRWSWRTRDAWGAAQGWDSRVVLRFGVIGNEVNVAATLAVYVPVDDPRPYLMLR